MVYVKDTNQQKGDAKWQRGIFLTKTLSNDMYLTAVGGALRLSRSIKMLYPNWSEHLEEYRQVLTFPWQLEGAIGSRTFPVVRGELVTADSVPGLDDEAAEDPEDELPPCPIEDLVPVATSMRRMPPPPTAVVSAPATVPPTPEFVQRETAEDIAVADEGAEQAGLPVPSLQAPGPVTPGMESTIEVEMFGEEATNIGEPDAKRARLSTMRVGSETLVHVDEDGGDLLQEFETGEFSFPLDAGETCGIWESEDFNSVEREMTEDDLWQPHSALEPILDPEQLQRIDDYADSVEIDRLLGMKVIEWHSNYKGELGTQLSAKFVRSWRKKVRKVFDENGKLVSEAPGWLRRSRLVAREFNWLDVREDVYSPSSSSSIVKLLPALAMSDGFCEKAVLGTLDVADAFLQVPQPKPRVVKLGNVELVILMCLPGQRDAAKLWYQHFTNVLQKKFSATICTEQPCVLKIQRKCAMVLHVDDVLFLGEQQWLSEVFLPGLKEEFKLSSTMVDWNSGGSFEFLKRFHVVEPQYKEITVYPEEKHIHTMFEKYSKANGKAPKLCRTPCNNSSTSKPHETGMEQPLNETLSAEFRSLVGIAMYVSQERFDLQFATKSLASHLKSPTRQAWADLGRLVGYMKFSESFALRMGKTRRGSSFQGVMFGSETETQNNLIETYSDSDWSNRSTSAAVHVLNGIVIWSTSRTQKCISLSSTEAEWYAATSAVCDSLFLHHILSFLTDDEVGTVVLHTDNSAVKMLSNKLGAGRLRHIKGRLLWLQAKVLSGDLFIKQVKTLYNIADLNTKNLAKDRHHFLLHMLGFVQNGEKVGETEFTRVQAKEMLKQQVNVISENFFEETGQHRTTKANKMAKQFLRALSVFSVMSLAEGTWSPIKTVSDAMTGTVEKMQSKFIDALGQWHVFAVFVICMMMVVIFMNPGWTRSGRRNRDEETADMEPSPEPMVSRYRTTNRSLGLKFPQTLSDPIVRAEGIIVWLHHRCEKRISRGNKPTTNELRKQTLVEMISACSRGMSEREKLQMRESLHSMHDLTDDEESPRFGMSDNQVRDECRQAVQAFDFGMDAVRLERDAGTENFVVDAENAENSSGTETETEEQRRLRYYMAAVDEVSQPDLWEEIQADYRTENREFSQSNDSVESEEARRRRYLFSERNEVSDTELYDAWVEEIMVENRVTAYGESSGM